MTLGYSLLYSKNLLGLTSIGKITIKEVAGKRSNGLLISNSLAALAVCLPLVPLCELRRDSLFRLCLGSA